jgi:cytochrome c-type biogenesis protein CcmH/NrfF
MADRRLKPLNRNESRDEKETDTMKKTISVMLCLGLAVFFMNAAAFAADPMQSVKTQINKTTIKNPVAIQLNADPLVENIYALQCPCAQELGSVNAFLMQDMWVTVFNGVCPGDKRAQVTATLKVRYYNLGTQNWDEKNVPITIPANSRKAVKIINGKTLVRKSTGITAEIINIKAPVKDCNPANNKKSIMTCSPPPVY